MSMNLQNLSHAAKQRLAAALWDERNKVDPRAFVEENRSSGLFVGDRAVEFYEVFGGITLVFPHFRVLGEKDSCHFNSSRASDIGMRHTVSKYESAIGSRLSVIGVGFSDHMTLYMDEAGKVYGGFDDLLLRFGDSGVDAINAFCEGRPGVRISLPERAPPQADAAIELSRPANRQLEKAGWAKRRTLQPHGNGSWRERFLHEFGGICFDYTIAGTDQSDRCCINGDVEIASAHLRRWQAQVHQALQPVGNLQRSGLVLLMGDDGRVFGGLKETPDLLFLMGASGKDAINRLVSGEPAIPVA